MKIKSALSLAAMAAVLVFAGTAAAGETFATVTGHEAFSEDANHASYWGDCSKDESVDGDLTFVLPEGFYGTVVVKSGAGEFANTIFEGASGGETVFADTNGNLVYDPEGPGGDKEISHVILCVETPPSAPPTEVPPTDEVTAPPTDEVTLPPDITNPPDTAPPTDTFEGTAAPTSLAPFLLLLLGLALGSMVIVGKPARR